MKKTIFTLSAIVVVCVGIIMACSKDDNSITHVGYAAQAGYGTGHNPNPNGLPSTSGYGTATTGGSSTTPPNYSATLNLSSGPVTGSVTSTTCAGTGMYGTCSNTQIGTITVSFPSAPVAGTTYSVVPSLPAGNQALVSCNGYTGTGGTVSISVVNGKNVATITNVTGTSPTSFTLSATFSCP